MEFFFLFLTGAWNGINGLDNQTLNCIIVYELSIDKHPSLNKKKKINNL